MEKSKNTFTLIKNQNLSEIEREDLQSAEMSMNVTFYFISENTSL